MKKELIRAKEVYDIYRTSLLNAKYYGFRLHRLRVINFILDAIVAVGAAGSGVAGWRLWESQGWKPVYLIIAGAASFLAIIKPLTQISKQIENYSKLFGAHTSNSMSLKKLVFEICSSQSVTDDHMRIYNDIYNRMIELASLDDPRPSEKLVLKFQDEVNRDVPVESLWWPKSDAPSQPKAPASTL